MLKKTVFTIFFIFVIFLFNCRKQIDTGNDILWYTEAAQVWEEALPLGNGRIGVMVFGDPQKERIQLNDDSMWPGDEGWDEPAGTANDLNKMRQLLFKGKNDQVDKLFVEKFSRKSVVRSHQTLGDLFIDFDHTNITDYKRELNISNATATVSYKTDGAQVTEEIFVTHPGQGIIIKFRSEKGLNGKIRMSRPQDQGFPTATTTTTDDGLLIMTGEVTQRSGVFNSKPAPILHGVKFETVLKIENKEGKVIQGQDNLELKNVSEAVFYLVSNSSYYHDDYKTQNTKDLNALTNSDYEAIRSRHIEDYQSLYNRVDLELTNQPLNSMPTDLRIEKIKQGEMDPGLEALLFQYGRYLLISSSRENTNPANLQGLWNEHITAPWNADYHLNINLQMNYWPADVTAIGELNNPLFDYIDKLIENGKVTAKKNFGCRGAFIPHATDLWAPTWLRAPTAYWGCSLGAGGWLMQHYWDHYLFTLDTEFLRDRAFPAMKAVAQFYSDWLIEDPRDDSLISAPSTSPENRFYNKKNKQVATCLGSAMDQQVIEEVFDNYIDACKALDVQNKLLDTIKDQRKKLRPGFVIADDGRILEWDRPYDEPEPGHRHISHIYGFHPGNAISVDRTPEIFEAVKTTLKYRLDHGGAGTGWSRAWLINCSARLLDGDMAHEHIQMLFRKSIYKNLFDGHPPFQIDGNFGYTAGVAEMLLQSFEKNTIRLLPALPSAWENGHIKGLKARGGFTVDLYWRHNALDKAVIKSQFNNNFNLIYKDTNIPVALTRGGKYTYKP